MNTTRQDRLKELRNAALAMAGTAAVVGVAAGFGVDAAAHYTAGFVGAHAQAGTNFVRALASSGAAIVLLEPAAMAGQKFMECREKAKKLMAKSDGSSITERALGMFGMGNDRASLAQRAMGFLARKTEAKVAQPKPSMP